MDDSRSFLFSFEKEFSHRKTIYDRLQFGRLLCLPRRYYGSDNVNRPLFKCCVPQLYFPFHWPGRDNASKTDPLMFAAGH